MKNDDLTVRTQLLEHVTTQAARLRAARSWESNINAMGMYVLAVIIGTLIAAVAGYWPRVSAGIALALLTSGLVAVIMADMAIGRLLYTRAMANKALRDFDYGMRHTNND